MRKIVITRRAPATTRPVRKGLRGLGQIMPSCATVDASQTVPQMVLLGGGSLAMLVGIIGAVVSDQYRKDFAITAAAGLAANVVGSIWAGNTMMNIYNQCGGAQGVAAALDQQIQQAQPQSAPAPVPAPVPQPSV